MAAAICSTSGAVSGFWCAIVLVASLSITTRADAEFSCATGEGCGWRRCRRGAGAGVSNAAGRGGDSGAETSRNSRDWGGVGARAAAADQATGVASSAQWAPSTTTAAVAPRRRGTAVEAGVLGMEGGGKRPGKCSCRGRSAGPGGARRPASWGAATMHAMKFATYADGSRDGQLVVVSRDLSQAHYATHVANRLQAVLDDWNYLAPQLQDVYDNLNAGRTRHAFAFDPGRCLAPLPRSHTLVQAQAYPHHGELLRRAAGGEGRGEDGRAPSPTLQALPAGTLGACTQMGVGLHEALEVDFEAQIAVVTGDVGADCTAERALDSVRLFMLAHATVLRAVERSAGAQDLAARPWHAFAPVAVTPDELGEAWSRGRVHLALGSSLNGRKIGMADCGTDMQWSLGQLVQHLCRLRPLSAGAVLCSGAVCNKGLEKRARMEWPKGYHSLAQRRGMEAWLDGQPSTPYLRLGDTVRSEVRARDGSSLFGAIEQTLGTPSAPVPGDPPVASARGDGAA